MAKKKKSALYSLLGDTIFTGGQPGYTPDQPMFDPGDPPSCPYDSDNFPGSTQTSTQWDPPSCPYDTGFPGSTGPPSSSPTTEVPPPPLPPPPSTGGGTPPVSWGEFDYSVEGAPTQWKALKPSALTERSEWFATMNMMIPFLPKSQQGAMGQLLAQEDPEHFGHLTGMTMGAPTLDRLQQQQDRWGGRRSLMQAMEALSRFRGATGQDELDMGGGYRYIQDMLSRMADFSSAGAPQSRLDYQNMMSQLGPMMEAAPEEYRGLASMFLNKGPQRGTQMGNQWQWGAPNPQLWG